MTATSISYPEAIAFLAINTTCPRTYVDFQQEHTFPRVTRLALIAIDVRPGPWDRLTKGQIFLLTRGATCLATTRMVVIGFNMMNDFRYQRELVTQQGGRSAGKIRGRNIKTTAKPKIDWSIADIVIRSSPMPPNYITSARRTPLRMLRFTKFGTDQEFMQATPFLHLQVIVDISVSALLAPQNHFEHGCSPQRGLASSK